ncbi:MAG: hypothetical protein ACFNME_00720, partial [Actinomyces dentalis]
MTSETDSPALSAPSAAPSDPAGRHDGTAYVFNRELGTAPASARAGLVEGYDFNVTQEHTCFRHAMAGVAARRGNARVHRFLAHRDPTAAERIHANNLRRVIRALEVARYGDESISRARAMEHGTLPDDAHVIGLMRERSH